MAKTKSKSKKATKTRDGPRTATELAKAQAHPMRVAIIALMGDKKQMSPMQLSTALDESLNLVAYHVRVLEKYGCVELVDTEQRRGATEHFYRSTGLIKAERTLTMKQRSLLATLVDEFTDQNGFSPTERSQLKDAGRILAGMPAA